MLRRCRRVIRLPSETYIVYHNWGQTHGHASVAIHSFTMEITKLSYTATGRYCPSDIWWNTHPMSCKHWAVKDFPCTSGNKGDWCVIVKPHHGECALLMATDSSFDTSYKLHRCRRWLTSLYMLFSWKSRIHARSQYIWSFHPNVFSFKPPITDQYHVLKLTNSWIATYAVP